ncbi:hypothetical protein BDN70DRAFT_872684 [Pholiota conissans]|uniref:Myb-like domain-containing protein n=1 Tax=Pholiota conissans TaxID=109636 RepID=A0A9P5ZDD0_9AGAR|nr:hypothetical protein BDN70DRAFT_872684 [Pholiota conissans]
MDNPQHYQPLSHALHPPSNVLNRGHNTQYVNANPHPPYTDAQNADAPNITPHEEEEEEEEADDDDEGLVEEQLNQNDGDMHGSDRASPQPPNSADANRVSSQNEMASALPEQKRRPGRPRGSKNRRPRVGSAKHESQFYYPPPASGVVNASTASPQHANISPQNQQYYEFQWRVLNLCAEFYGAAEELVKGTSPLVIAQCYSMGPGVKIDPLVMLAEAKRICDALLANPAQLVVNPPPPVYPVLPTIYQPMSQPTLPMASTSTIAPTPSSGASVTPSTMITNPQTFVVPLGAQPGYPQYPVYAAHGQYPTTPYYQYPYGQPGTYYAPPQPMAAPPQPMTAPPPPTIVSAPAPAPSTQPTATITTTPATGGTVIGNQGAWSDEETERLKKLTEESRSKGSTGDIEWDWVIQEWGISRTRHQILIKATAMGLKESSTRGIKRRRDNEEPTSSVPPPMSSLQQPSTSISSPAQSTSQPTSTPTASPALQNQQRPSSSKGPGTLNAPPASKLPWPMPTVAVNTASPVISGSSNVHEQQRSSYYRPRPSQDSSANQATMTPVQHQFMYTPNGQMTSSMRPKENGK